MWKKKTESEPPPNLFPEPEPEPEKKTQKEPEAPKAQPFVYRPPPELENPGKFEDLSVECSNLLSTSEFFEGLHVDIKSAPSTKLELTNSFAIGSETEKPNYTLGAMYSGEGRMVYGRMSTEGSTMGRWTESFDKMDVTVQAQVNKDPTMNGFRVESDYRGSNWTLGLRWTNPGLYTMNYYQRLSHRLSMGVDWSFSHKQAASVTSYGLRYIVGQYIVSSTLASHMVSVGFVKLIQASTGAGAYVSTEFQAGPVQGGGIGTTWAAGIDYRLRAASYRLRVDNDFNIHQTYEEGSDKTRLQFFG